MTTLTLSSADRTATGDSTSQKSWWYEITGHVHFSPGLFEQFLKDLVPCSVPYTLDHDLSHVFDAYVPVQGHEDSGYSSLVSRCGASYLSLTAIVDVCFGTIGRYV